MIVQLGTGTRVLVQQAEVHVLAVDHRCFARGEVRRKVIRLEILEAVKAHAGNTPD